MKSNAYVTERLEVLKSRIIGRDPDDAPEKPPVRLSAPARPLPDLDERPAWDSNTKIRPISPQRLS